MKKLLILLLCFVLPLVNIPMVQAQARTKLNPALTSNGGDLTYLGAFAMPLSVNGSGTGYGSGLALRRVGGQVRLFSTAMYAGSPNQYPLYEVTPPVLTQSAPWNTATVVNTWGTAFSSLQSAMSTNDINGLYWDETDSRLYVSSYNVLNYGGRPTASACTSVGSPWACCTGSGSGPNCQYTPSLGYVTLGDDGSGTSMPHGPWGFSGRSVQMVDYGVLRIPPNGGDALDTVLGSKHLAAGFGGYGSVMDNPVVSMGPSLTAFDPSLLTSGNAQGYVSNTPLVGYPHSTWESGARPTIDRCWRPDDFIDDTYALSDPDNSFLNNGIPAIAKCYSGDESVVWQGYSITSTSRQSLNMQCAGQNFTQDCNGNTINYTQPNTPSATVAITTKHWAQGEAFWDADFVRQAGAWIQTTNKEGLLFGAYFMTGHGFYQCSNLGTQGAETAFLVYSRDDINNVANGSIAQDQIQPTRTMFPFPGQNASTAGYTPPPYGIIGMAYDPIDQNLYIGLQFASSIPINAWSTMLVYVYHVNDSSGDDSRPPVMSNPLPSGMQSCSSNPLSVSLQVTTDEGATCKYSTSDVSYDAMANIYSTGTESTAHSQLISLTCGSSHTYYSRCKDSSGNIDTASATHSFNIGELATPDGFFQAGWFGES